MRKCSVFLKDNGGDIVARDCADEIDRLRNRLEALTAPVEGDGIDYGAIAGMLKQLAEISASENDRGVSFRATHIGQQAAACEAMITAPQPQAVQGAGMQVIGIVDLLVRQCAVGVPLNVNQRQGLLTLQELLTTAPQATQPRLKDDPVAWLVDDENTHHWHIGDIRIAVIPDEGSVSFVVTKGAEVALISKPIVTHPAPKLPDAVREAMLRINYLSKKFGEGFMPTCADWKLIAAYLQEIDNEC
jgi:hypothetical protein